MENHISEEITQKKRFLKRYRKNVACVSRLEEKYKTLDERIKSMRSSNLSGMPRGGVPVTIDDLLSDKSDLENRIKRLRSKGRKIKAEILDEIDSLDDIRYCAILEAYFIDCLPFEIVAEKEGYSVRHTYTLYTEAISLLTVNTQ